ncbi:MAG: hypothetical protein JWM59_2289 [Verrucomicrobiales bacterium]|nr:hypothetical protein [Verrucomicrobiales bacterium]
MKKPNFLLPAAAVSLFLPALSLAQTITSGLPGFISYQGRVLNSSGELVGTGTPVNRTVTFRVWDHPSNTQAANLIYSETQTVTISDGEFSVLVGQGVATTETPFNYNEATKGLPDSQIANAFNGKDRYLGVTVEDGTPAADNEISPRQQIVSSAFAFRAKYAESIGTGTGGAPAVTALDSGNIGVGNSNPPSRVTITGANTTSSTSSPQLLITDSADTNERLRIGVDSTGSGTGFLQSFKEGTGVQNLLLNPSGGNVGINKTNPGAPLDVNGVIRTHNGQTGAPAVGENGGAGQRIVLWPGSLTSVPYGFGIDSSTLWQAVPTDSYYKWYDGITEKMRLYKGNLGIGATDVPARLTLGEISGTPANQNGGTMVLDHENTGGASSIVFRSKGNRGSDFGYLQYQDAATLNGGGEAAVLTLGISNDADDHIALMPSGNVGIGTTSPTAAKLHVVGGTLQNLYGGLMNGAAFYIDGGIFGGGGITGATVGSYYSGVSIYGNGTIWAGNAVIASSDERIKVIKGHSNSAADLNTLMKIEVTDYQYKDKVSKGDTPQKKVIAQQVEKIFPQAVGKQTEVIPDIFKPATIKDGWIKLVTDLKAGERVRLITQGNEGVYEVLEVKQGMFRTRFEPVVLTVAGAPSEAGKVFVYGREVNDFRTVDYEALSMLNVSATQELKKEADLKLKAITDENALLRSRLAELETKETERSTRLADIEAKEKARQARLDEIEKLLQSSAGSTKAGTSKAGK